MNSKCRVLLAGLFAIGLLHSAEVEPKTTAYRVSFHGVTDMEVGGKPVKLINDIFIDYTRRVRGNEVEVQCKSLAIKNLANGKVTYDAKMDRTRMSVVDAAGKKTNVAAEDDPQTKSMLEDQFGKPLATLRLDDEGRELKRSLSPAPGARVMIEVGFLSNCLLFHAPCPARENKWNRAFEYAGTGVGIVSGELTYEKAPVEPGTKGTVVKVSGILQGDKVTWPIDGKVIASGVKMKIEGQQHWLSGEWHSGVLQATLTIVIHPEGKDVEMKTAMEIKLERLDPEPKK